MTNKNLLFSLDQLLILRAIAAEKSFKAAAQTLCITQSSVSTQMQNLERQLKTTIFDRAKKKVEFTETGILLVRYSVRILNTYKESVTALEDLNCFQSGKLSIGASQTTGTHLMLKIIGLFRQMYPGINIQLKVGSTRDIVWDIINRHIDVAIVGGSVPTELKNIVTITPYAEDELVLTVGSSHPLSSRSYISKEELYSLKFINLASNSTIRSILDYSLTQSGIDITRFTTEMELNSIESIKNAVQSGLGVAFVPISSILKEVELGLVTYITIEDLKITRVLSLVVDSNRSKSNATQKFNKEILTLFLKTI